MLDEGRLLGHEQRVSGPVERVLLLKRLPMVSKLSGAQLAFVAEQITERFFPKGSVLLREGEPPAALYFPVEGRVHLTRNGRVLGHAGPGLAVAPFHGRLYFGSEKVAGQTHGPGTVLPQLVHGGPGHAPDARPQQWDNHRQPGDNGPHG